jgi:GNAT superfamily N-acetyltransferase/catechol 2,3-dioxygenase-like lactoylglutathione lyase family enzyme
MYQVLPARPRDLPLLADIELAAARLLNGWAPESVLLETTPLEDLRLSQAGGCLWVALDGDMPVGFAQVKLLEPRVAHLDEIDVDPAHGRRGVGTHLVAAVCDWADAMGFHSVTLSTFSDVPWNRPFYERCGFTVIPPEERSAALRLLVDTETKRGLDPTLRVVMRRLGARQHVVSTAPQLRIARPSRDLDLASDFYRGVMGLELLGAFQDHAGFDGVILGHSSWPYHLELTRHRTRPVIPATTDEDLLVFYYADPVVWSAVAQRIRDAGAVEMTPTNPYWRSHAVTFADPDGYRIVITPEIW